MNQLLLAFVVLLIMVGVWFALHLWLTPYLHCPDGRAARTGRCGDTMEISLVFDGERVAKTAYASNGCVHSLNCLTAAADLAVGKTPDEIMTIDADRIRESVGGLSTDYMHCASLAVETLWEAAEDRVRRQVKAQSKSWRT
jgi:nitrogen fixation NifU-like protein